MAIEAVAEVGNPTAVITLSVIAALLRTLFVLGMMGRFIAQIRANASAAVVFLFLW